MERIPAAILTLLFILAGCRPQTQTAEPQQWYQKEKIRGFYNCIHALHLPAEIIARHSKGKGPDAHTNKLLDEAKTRGFNVVTIGVYPEFFNWIGPAWLDAPEIYAEHAKMADLAQARGLHVLGNFHHSLEGFAKYDKLDFSRLVGYDGKQANALPCPIDPVHWNHVAARSFLHWARLSVEHRAVFGALLDIECYGISPEAHAKYGETGCVCDYCFKGFLKQKQMEAALPGFAERHKWLKERDLVPEYEAWQAEQLLKLGRELRAKIDAINPDFHMGFAQSWQSNWYYDSLLKGLSSPRAPALMWDWNTYTTGYAGNCGYVASVVNRAKQKLGHTPLWLFGIYMETFPPPDLAEACRDLGLHAPGYLVFHHGDVKQLTKGSLEEYTAAFRKGNAELRQRLAENGDAFDWSAKVTGLVEVAKPRLEEIQIKNTSAGEMAITTKDVDNDGAAEIVLSSATRQIAINPTGAKLISWKVQGREYVLRTKDFNDGAAVTTFWIPVFGRWNGPQVAGKYVPLKTQVDEKQAVVTMGIILDDKATALENLVITKTFRLERGNAPLAVNCAIRTFRSDAVEFSFWVHNLLRMQDAQGQTVNPLRQALVYADEPTALRRTTNSAAESVLLRSADAPYHPDVEKWEKQYLSGSFKGNYAALEDPNSAGRIAATFNPDQVYQIYRWANTNIVTLEWMYKPVKLPAGGLWETDFQLEVDLPAQKGDPAVILPATQYASPLARGAMIDDPTAGGGKAIKAKGYEENGKPLAHLLSHMNANYFNNLLKRGLYSFEARVWVDRPESRFRTQGLGGAETFGIGYAKPQRSSDWLSAPQIRTWTWLKLTDIRVTERGFQGPLHVAGWCPGQPEADIRIDAFRFVPE